MQETPARTPILKVASTPGPARKLDLGTEASTPPKLIREEDEDMPSTQPHPLEPPASPVPSFEEKYTKWWEQKKWAYWGMWNRQSWWKSTSWEWDGAQYWEEDAGEWEDRASYGRAWSSSDVSSTASPKRATLRAELARGVTTNMELHRVQEEAAATEDDLEKELADLMNKQELEHEHTAKQHATRTDTEATLNIDETVYEEIAKKMRQQKDTQQEDTQQEHTQQEDTQQEASGNLQLCRATPIPSTPAAPAANTGNTSSPEPSQQVPKDAAKPELKHAPQEQDATLKDTVRAPSDQNQTPHDQVQWHKASRARTHIRSEARTVGPAGSHKAGRARTHIRTEARAAGCHKASRARTHIRSEARTAGPAGSHKGRRAHAMQGGATRGTARHQVEV